MTTLAPDNLTRALAYLEKLPRAVSGSAGHKATFQAVLACRRLGLSEGDTWEALQWFNANRCDPPWSERELRHKLMSAEKIDVQRPLASDRRDWHQTVKPVGALAPIGPVGFKPRPKADSTDAMVDKSDSVAPEPSTDPRALVEAAWMAAHAAWCADPQSLELGQAFVRASIVAGTPCYGADGVDLGTAGWLAYAERELTPTAPAPDDGYWSFVLADGEPVE